MAITNDYRQQHADLVKLVTKVAPLLTGASAAEKAGEIRKALSELMGKLNMHLAMEDNSLYPLMLKSANSEMSVMATKFKTEMGGIKAAVVAFNSKWTEQTIKDKPVDFCNECKGIFDALGKRIQAENTQLYAMYDKIAS